MNSNSKETDQLLQGEILASSKLGSYMSFAFGLSHGTPNNPSWVWEQLRWNPWLAMAVYDDLEDKDDMIASCLDTRKEAVLSKSRRVLPASKKRQDVALASFIEETLEGYFDATDGTRLGLDSFLWEALDAIYKGVAIGENVFSESSDRIFIKDVKFKPQHLFTFGEGMMAAYSTSTYPYPQTGPLRLRPGIVAEGLSGGELLLEKKFFVFSFRPRYGNRWGSPLGRRVFWPSWFKRADVKNWLRYGEKGAGSVVAKYPGGASTTEKQLALDAARAVVEESAVAIPDKFPLELLEHVRGGGMGSVFRELADDFCNNGIARVILGQTLTSRGSEGGGSRALGEVHERVAGRKTEVDAKSLMLAVNTRLVWPLLLLNKAPVAQPPVWTIDYEPGADLDALSRMIQRLWQMHVPISRNSIYNTFPIEAPTDEADTLEPPSQGQEDLSPSDSGSGGDFAEGQKKKPGALSSGKSSRQQSLRMERFQKLRPSGMRRSAG
jgi:phage gp29-like protein